MSCDSVSNTVILCMAYTHIDIGKIGEDTVLNYYQKLGFLYKERNYRKKWGEIDLIFLRGHVLHFVEVKTVLKTQIKSDFHPHERVDDRKLLRLGRTIETYLLEKKLTESLWQFDIAAVEIDLDSKSAEIEVLDNIIIGS
jgi:putative endonuclease